jgi:hypothetical protein
MFLTRASKLKLKPSTLEALKGRSALEVSFSRPKVAYSLFAPSTAASGDVKPPSVYAEPPIKRSTVLPLD